MANFDNIKFGLRKGYRSDLNRTAIADVGTFNICKDTKELVMDLDGNRYLINSANFDYTEEQILNLENPEKKLYIAKDTFKVCVFDTVNLRWLIIGENGVMHHADRADQDGDGRNIRETYFTKSEARTYMTNTDASIQELEEALAILSKYIIEVYENEEELPEEGTFGTVYFVLDPESEEGNPVYNEYIWVSEGYYVRIGTTFIDLKQYVTKASLQEQLEEVDNRMSSMASSISDTDSELSDLNDAFASTTSDFESRISDLESDNTINKNNISSHASSISNILDNISTLEEYISSHASSISDINTLIGNIISSMSDMNLSIANLESAVNGGSSGSTASSGIASRVSELESSMSIVVEVTGTNLEKIEANSSSISSLEDSMSSMASSISDLEDAVDNHASSISDLEDSRLNRIDDERDMALDFATTAEDLDAKTPVSTESTP